MFVLSAALSPEAGAARPGNGAAPFREAYFEATIEGTQTNTWHEVSAGVDECDPTVRTQGTEVTRFSRRPFPMRVRYYTAARSAPDIEQWGVRPLGHRMTAVVIRSASDDVSTVAER